MKINEMNQKDQEQIKTIIAKVFDLYCECDHTNFVSQSQPDDIIPKLEAYLWDSLVKLEDNYGIKIKEVNNKIDAKFDE